MSEFKVKKYNKLLDKYYEGTNFYHIGKDSVIDGKINHININGSDEVHIVKCKLKEIPDWKNLKAVRLFNSEIEEDLPEFSPYTYVIVDKSSLNKIKKKHYPNLVAGPSRITDEDRFLNVCRCIECYSKRP